MKKTYQVLAFLIALEVIVQATAIAWGLFGFADWIDKGNTFSKEDLDCEDCGWNFTAERGFMIHGINGFMIVPLISLIFLIVSFFAKIPGGVKWALGLFVLVILQSQFLPELSREFGAGFGALHGLNAMVIFAVAIMAGKRVTTARAAEPEPEVPAAV
jgi:hypothetical protein